MIDVIYLDMDVVLTDFDLRYQELFGTPASKVSKKNWPKFWEEFVGGEESEGDGSWFVGAGGGS